MGRKPKTNVPKHHSVKQRHDSRTFTSSDSQDEAEEIQTWKRDLHLCAITSFALLAIYAKCLYPSIPGGDSGELIVSAHELGVAHPPGYPLFTLLSKLIMTALPLGSPALRINLMTACCGAAAGGLLQFTILRVTGCVGSSFLGLGMFSLSRLTWTWSVTGEVFGLNNLFVSLLVYLAVMSEDNDEPHHVEKYVYIGCFVSGLSLSNQHTVIIYVICIACWVFLRLLKLHMLGTRLVMKAGFFFALGLLPYVYLPLSAHMNTARWTWGDQTTLSGFLTHVLRSEYGTFDLGKDQSGPGFLHGLWAYWEHAHSDLCELGPFMALIGGVVATIWRFQGRGSSVFVCATMLVAYMSFFAWRANLDMENALMRGVVERFWMQSDLVVSLLAAVGFNTAVRLVTEAVMGSSQLPMSKIFAMIGGAVICILQLRNFIACDHSSNLVVHDFARTLLENMPRNAIIFSKGDLPTNSMRYLHLCENVRPDLHILDVEILSYGWSLPMLRQFYPRITFPGDTWSLNNGRLEDGRTTFNFRSLLDSNYGKYPLFACIGMQERDPSWQGVYETRPFGVCSKILKTDSPFNPTHWANITGGLADAWIYPFDKFGDTSWEKVANDEMWNAKINTAFYMYQMAQQTKDERSKTHLLLEAYDLYFRAIKLNQHPGKMATNDGFPPFWHKNFALACEKLLHVGPHELEPARLCKLAIYHFEQYVRLETTDPDKPQIEEAIRMLQERHDTFHQFRKVDKHLEDMAKRAAKMGQQGVVTSDL